MEFRRQKIKYLLFHVNPKHPASLELHPLGKPLELPEFVEFAGDHPGVPSRFIEILLEVVHLLDDDHGDDDIVLQKGEEGCRVVEENIGIENVNLPRVRG